MAISVVCKVVGIGSIRIRTHDGVFCTSNDVRHVLQMTKDLITLSAFDSSIVTGCADTASSEMPAENMTKLWHMGLGHMGERRMQILSKRDFLSRHKVKNLDFYEQCIFGKLYRNKFPKKGVHRTKGTLNYIHMDC
ncbi:uncharacterized mitochondrial protein AtMg00300-like [Salvia hispanica]|uniref:uncharacterized mitochondrial protein AtMg00300-like n=1 Tax=Salvia hispanica TaxID=49212 RepID=UPI00200982E3|nr:uncharacterized mitochondrial protein AtMg00300-like [Salvia hispanica]